MSVRHRRFALEVLKNKNLSISLQNPIRPTETVAKCWKDHEKMKFGIVRVVKRYKKKAQTQSANFSQCICEKIVKLELNEKEMCHTK